MNLDTSNFKRLLLAIFLMTFLLVVYNEFFTLKNKSTSKKNIRTHQIANSVKINNQKQKIENPFLIKLLKNNEYSAIFSTNGGQIQNLTLTNYRTPIAFFPQLILESRDSNFPFSSETHYDIVNESKNNICFQAITSQNIQINRCYYLSNQPFLIQHSVKFKNLNSLAKSISFDLIMRTEEDLNKKEDYSKVVFRAGDKYNYFSSKDLMEHPGNIPNNPVYIAFDQRYFLMSLNPETSNQKDGIAESFNQNNKKITLIKLKERTFILQPEENKIFKYSLYAGPKKINFLEKVNGNLKENIDFGWFGSLSQPLLFLLVWINNFTKNFGTSIVVLTFLIKILTFPLTQKSFSAQQQMKKIMPKLKQLQEKFAHDKSMLGQKQMELYKEEGINPMSGCFPVLIQMPIWFALYQMLGNSVELYEQPFYFWIKDLTHPDPLFILPVGMGVSMFISQWLMPPTVDDSHPQMKYALWIMPIFLTIVMLNLPSGLSIYMLINNLLTIFQQIYIKKRFGEI